MSIDTSIGGGTSRARPQAARTSQPAQTAQPGQARPAQGQGAQQNAQGVNSVRDMQVLMGNLHEELIKKESIPRIPNNKQNEAKALLPKFSATQAGAASGGRAAHDGVWGANTTTALNAVIQFIALLDGVNPKPVITSNRGNDPEGNAKKNIEELIKLMRIVGVAVPSQYAQQARVDEYDIIPNRLTESNYRFGLDDPYWRYVYSNELTGTPVRPSDVDSIISFFNFISNVPSLHVDRTIAGYAGGGRNTRAEDLSSISQKIIMAGFSSPLELLSFAQEMSVAPETSTTRNPPNYTADRPTRSSSSGHATDRTPPARNQTGGDEAGIRIGSLAIADMDAAIRWFINRSTTMPSWINSAMRDEQRNTRAANASYGAGLPIFTEAHYNAAVRYDRDMDRLAREWASIRSRIARDAARSGTAEESIPYITIDPSMLSGDSSGHGRSRVRDSEEGEDNGRGYSRRSERGGRGGRGEGSGGEYGGGITPSDYIYAPEINLERLNQFGVLGDEDYDNLMRYLRAPYINYNIWSRSSLPQLMNSELQRNRNPGEAMSRVCTILSESLDRALESGHLELQAENRQLAATWRSNQNPWRQRWQAVFTRKGDEAYRYEPEAPRRRVRR